MRFYIAREGDTTWGGKERGRDMGGVKGSRGSKVHAWGRDSEGVSGYGTGGYGGGDVAGK